MSKRSRWFDLVMIALIAAVSIVAKPYLRAPFAFVQTTFGMPVGAFIGGIYMFWPLLAGYMVPRRGVVLLTCVLQGLLAIVTGFLGLLGPPAFLSYIAPGLVIEALFLIPGAGLGVAPRAGWHGAEPAAQVAAGTAASAAVVAVAGTASAEAARPARRLVAPGFIALLWAIVAGALGNTAGAAVNALLYFSLKGQAFTVAVVASLLTGGLGGWLAAVVGRRLAAVYRRDTHAPARESLAGTGRR